MSTGSSNDLVLRMLTDEELAAEVERRAKLVPERPRQLDQVDIPRILRVCLAVVERVVETGFCKDHENLVFEEVMLSVYGPRFFGWWNRMHNDRIAP